MNIINTVFSDVKIIEPKVFGDERGFFWKLSGILGSESMLLTLPLFRIIIASRLVAYYVDCIISLYNRKANWFV